MSKSVRNKSLLFFAPFYYKKVITFCGASPGNQPLSSAMGELPERATWCRTTQVPQLPSPVHSVVSQDLKNIPDSVWCSSAAPSSADVARGDEAPTYVVRYQNPHILFRHGHFRMLLSPATSGSNTFSAGSCLLMDEI